MKRNNKIIILSSLLTFLFLFALNINVYAFEVFDDGLHSFAVDSLDDIENSRYLIHIPDHEFKVSSDSDLSFKFENGLTSSQVQMIEIKNGYNYKKFNPEDTKAVEKLANEHNVFYKVEEDYCFFQDASIEGENLMWFEGANDDYAIAIMPYMNYLYVIKTFHKDKNIKDTQNKFSDIYYALFTVVDSFVLDKQQKETSIKLLHYYMEDSYDILDDSNEDEDDSDVSEEEITYPFEGMSGPLGWITSLIKLTEEGTPERNAYYNFMDDIARKLTIDDLSPYSSYPTINGLLLFVWATIYVLLNLIFLKLLIPKKAKGLRKFVGTIFTIGYFLGFLLLMLIFQEYVPDEAPMISLVIALIMGAVAAVPRKTMEEKEEEREKQRTSLKAKLKANSITIDNGSVRREITRDEFESINDDPIIKGRKLGKNDDDPFVK